MSRKKAAVAGFIRPGMDAEYVRHRAEQARSGAAGKHADRRLRRARTRAARTQRERRITGED